MKVARHRRRRAGGRNPWLWCGLLLIWLGAAADLFLSERLVAPWIDEPFDRALFGAARAIEAAISTVGGTPTLNLPPRMFEFLQISAGTTVRFHVETEDGRWRWGQARMPALPPLLITDQPQFTDEVWLGEPVRRVILARPGLPSPVTGGAMSNGSTAPRLIIQVTEGLQARQALKRRWRQACLWRNVSLALWFSVGLIAVMRHRPERPARSRGS